MPIDIDELNAFIVRAKAATYVGSGKHAEPCRLGSHDLHFTDGKWSYLDSYFGGTDFSLARKLYIWKINLSGR